MTPTPLLAYRLEGRLVRRVSSSDVFALVAEVYGTDTETAQEALIGYPSNGSYFHAKTSTDKGTQPLPATWDGAAERSVSLDALFADLWRRGMVPAGDYILLHSW